MGQEPDRIRQEVDQKREDAARKLDQIEHRVEHATHEVKGTVDQTRQQAMDMVEQAKQQAKETFDLRRQVEQKPLVALGAAFLGGLVLGGVTGGGGEQQGQQQGQQQRPHDGRQHRERGGGIAEGIKRAAKESGLQETLTSMAAAAMGTANDRLKEGLDRRFPGFAGKYQQARQADGDLAAKSQVTLEASAPQAATGAHQTAH